MILEAIVISGAVFRCGYKKFVGDNKEMTPPDVNIGNQPPVPIIMETNSELAPAPTRSAYQFQDIGPPQWLPEPPPAPFTVPARVTTPAPIYQPAPAMAGPMGQRTHQQTTTPISLYNSHTSAQ